MPALPPALLIGAAYATSAVLACAALAVVGRATLGLMGLTGLTGLPDPAAQPAAEPGPQGRDARAWGARALALFLWVSAGAAVATALLFVLGLAGALRARPVGVALAALAMLSLAWVWRMQAAGPGSARWHPNLRLPLPLPLPLPPVAVTWVFICLLVGLSFWAIRPPGLWDDTSYHLPYARHYLEQGGIALNPYLRFPLFPHNAHLWFAVGLMAGSDVPAQVMATALPTALTALGVFGLGTWLLGSRLAGVAAVALLLWAPPLREALGYAYVDHLLMWFSTAAVAALVLATQAQQQPLRIRWIVLCGLLAGTAAGTKTFGALVAVILGLLILLLPGLRWRAAWPYALAVACSGLGWYLRSWAVSGDPVHPLGGGLFGHHLWNAADLQAQHQEQATHGVSRAWGHLPQALGAAGLAVLVPAFLAPLWPSLRSPAWWAVTGVFAAYTLVWHTSTQVARYMTCVLPLGALLVTAMVWQVLSRAGPALGRGRGVAGAHRAASVAWGLGMLAATLALQPPYQAMAQRLQAWQAELGARSGYELMRAASGFRSAHGPVLVQVGFENAVYFFEGRAVGDWFGPGRYSQMLVCAQVCSVAPSARMVQVLREHGARMLVVNAKRFGFDAADFEQDFEVLHRARDGVLLALRPAADRPQASETGAGLR